MVRAKNIVIGITGTMTSGKGALQYFLVDRGFKAIRNTQPILDEGLKRKLDMTDRKNWLDILIELRKKKGVEILVKNATENFKENERYVICPIRHPADIKYLKKNYNALILFVDAPFETRYKRTFLSEIGAGLTKNEFKKKDEFEYDPKGENSNFLPNLKECEKLADEILKNNGSLNDLNQKLDKLMRKYKIPDLVDNEAYEDFDM